jgi:hypothetical protein
VLLPAVVRGDAVGAAVVSLGVACVAGALWSLASFNGWSDLAVGLPMAALGLGAAAGLVRHRLPRPWGVRLVALWCVATLVAAVVGSVATREDTLIEQRREIREVMAQGPDDATMMSFGAPGILVLTGRTNPVPYQSFMAGLQPYVDDTYPGGFDAFVDFVVDQQATYLVFDNPDAYPWLHDLLESDYARIGKVGRSVWFVNRDVGADTIKQMRTTTQQLAEDRRADRL